MKRTSLALAAALLALSPLVARAQPAPPAGAKAGPGSEADRRFKRGIELYNEGDFNAALIEFRRAYELDPRYQALYNIGETYFQQQDYASALKTLEKYLKDGGAQIAEARRDEVQKEIEKLRARVATIDVVSRTAGVEIAVDDVPAGRTPLAGPITVSAGKRRVSATRPGKPPVTQTVEIAGGDAKKIALDFPDDGSSEEKRSVPPAPWIVTGVLAAGAVATGVVSLSASSSLRDKLAAMPGDPDAIKSAHGKTFALALTTDILTGAAVAMAGVSIYFTVAALSPKKAESKPAVGLVLRGAPPPAALRLGAGPRGALLTGSF